MANGNADNYCRLGRSIAPFFQRVKSYFIQFITNQLPETGRIMPWLREVAAEILWRFFVPLNLNMLYLFQLFFIFRICMAFHLYFQIVQNLSATFFIQYIKLSKELVK